MQKFHYQPWNVPPVMSLCRDSRLSHLSMSFIASDINKSARGLGRQKRNERDNNSVCGRTRTFIRRVFH